MPSLTRSGRQSSTYARASNHVQALIIGAGPVGLTLAVDLLQRGISCRIIDKSPTGVHTSRAAGIVPRSLEVFGALGVAPAMLEAGNPLASMAMMAGRKTLARLPFDELDTPYPYLLVLAQSDTERLLGERLATLGGRVERGLSLLRLDQDAASVRAFVRPVNAAGELTAVSEAGDELITADWLIGCDGAHSTVRKAANMKFLVSPYPEHLGLADCELDIDLPTDQASIQLSDDGVVGFIPFKEPKRFRVFAQLPVSLGSGTLGHGQPGTLAADVFLRLVARRLPQLHIKLLRSSWSAAFRVHRRSVDRMRCGRIFVAGDAAHIQSPAGGQGMNVGVQDAFNLGWKLALVCRGEAATDLLDSYHAERQATYDAVSRNTNAIMKAVTLKHPWLRAARDRLAHFAFGFGIVQQKAAAAMAETALDYRGSGIVGEAISAAVSAPVELALMDKLSRRWLPTAAGLQPGDRMPDAPLGGDGSDGVHGRLRSGKHLLLFFTGDPQYAGQGAGPDGVTDLLALAGRCQERWGKICDVYVISTRALSAGPFGVRRIDDTERWTHQRFGMRMPGFYLVRPDGYIGWRGLPNDLDDVAAYFTKAHLLATADTGHKATMTAKAKRRAARM